MLSKYLLMIAYAVQHSLCMNNHGLRGVPSKKYRHCLGAKGLAKVGAIEIVACSSKFVCSAWCP